MFRRILVPLDGSDRAAQAIPVAARIARASGGSILLARAATIPTVYGTYSENSYMAEMVENEMRNASDYLAVALSDEVAGAIIQAAEYGEDAAGAGVYGHCDMIAMATHGRAGFQHRALGSTTERVLGATRLPLLIVRPAEAEFLKTGEEKVPASQGL